ncbi:hypothetical protein Hanom_Chr17g01575551 [Helianthus anomalus]
MHKHYFSLFTLKISVRNKFEVEYDVPENKLVASKNTSSTLHTLSARVHSSSVGDHSKFESLNA